MPSSWRGGSTKIDWPGSSRCFFVSGIEIGSAIDCRHAQGIVEPGRPPRSEPQLGLSRGDFTLQAIDLLLQISDFRAAVVAADPFGRHMPR